MRLIHTVGVSSSRLMRSRILLHAFGFVAMAMSPCATVSQTAEASSSAPPSTYRLQNGDSVSIFYRLTPEYNQSLTVLPDGNVDLRLIGPVHLAGLTAEEARQSITTLASRRLRDPDVSVSVVDFVREQFTIMGEVGRAGRYELRGPMTLVDGLALANGFTQLSAQRHVVLVRPLSAHSEYGNATVYDYKHLLNVKKTNHIPLLQAGDIVVVTTSKFAKITTTLRLLNVGLYFNPLSSF